MEEISGPRFGANMTALAQRMLVDAETQGIDAPAWAIDVVAQAPHPGHWGDDDLGGYTDAQLRAAVIDRQVATEDRRAALRLLVEHQGGLHPDGFSGEDLVEAARTGLVTPDQHGDLLALLDVDTLVELVAERAQFMAAHTVHDHPWLRLLAGVNLTEAQFLRFVEAGHSWSKLARTGLVPDGGFLPLLRRPAATRPFDARDRARVGVAGLLNGEVLDLGAARAAFGKFGTKGDRSLLADEDDGFGHLVRSGSTVALDATDAPAIAALLCGTDTVAPRILAALAGVLDADGTDALARYALEPNLMGSVTTAERVAFNGRLFAAIAVSRGPLDPEVAVALHRTARYRYDIDEAPVHTALDREGLVACLARSLADTLSWMAGRWTANPYDPEVLDELVSSGQLAVPGRYETYAVAEAQQVTDVPARALLDLFAYRDSQLVTLVAGIDGPGAREALRTHLGGDITAEQAARALGLAR